MSDEPRRPRHAVWKERDVYSPPLLRSSLLSPQHYFLVVFGHDGQKPLELRSEEEVDCDEWVEVIQQARYTCGTGGVKRDSGLF